MYLCKAGLAAWAVVQRPTFTVDILYPTWQVESSSWPCASFQEHVAVCTAKGGWTPFAFFSPVEERTFTCWLVSSGEGTELLSVSKCKLRSVFARSYTVFLEDLLSIMYTCETGRTAPNILVQNSCLPSSRGKGNLPFCLSLRPVLPASLNS